jgi:ankyrin repeat protein
MDDLSVDQEFLLAIGDGNVDLLGELLSPTKQRPQQQRPQQQQRRGRRQRRAGITDDFLHDILCFFFKCNTFHPQVCRLLCNSMSPSLIQDYKSGRRDSHLFAAAVYGRVEAFKFLVHNYGNDDDDIFSIHRLYNGRPLLYHAAITRYHSLQQSQEMCRFLVASGGANPNQLDSVGWTPLNHAVRLNNTDLVCLLLDECHADPSIVANTNGQQSEESNVDHAIFRGNARILALLLAHGAVLNNFVILVGVLAIGMYPVVDHVQQQNTRHTKRELCRSLAHHVALQNNKQHSDSDSTTFETVQVALECVIYLGYNDICAIFFETGLIPTFRAMYCAIESGNEPAARLLVQYGVDPFAYEAYEYDVLDQDNRAASPFHAAARVKQATAILEYFLTLWSERMATTSGVGVGGKDAANGDCPIHVLCRDRHVSIHAIRLLVEKFQANVSQPDRYGLLPLQLAFLSNASVDVIYYLLNRCPSALLWCWQQERRLAKDASFLHAESTGAESVGLQKEEQYDDLDVLVVPPSKKLKTSSPH